MKTSTNALTKRLCAQKGWPHECVQSWRGKVRHDLFGIADSIILFPGGEQWVQNCSYGTLSAHRKEIDKNPHIQYLDQEKKQIALWEWRKKKVDGRGLWFLRVQEREDGKWGEIYDWDGPFDLYPKKLTIQKAKQ